MSARARPRRLLALLALPLFAGAAACTGPSARRAPRARATDELVEVGPSGAAAAERGEEPDPEAPPIREAPPLPAHPPETVQFTRAPRDTRVVLRYAPAKPVLLRFSGEVWDRKLAKIKKKLQAVEDKREGLRGLGLLWRAPGGEGWRAYAGYFHTERAVDRFTASGHDFLHRVKLLPSRGRTAEVGRARFGDRGVNPTSPAAPGPERPAAGSILGLLAGRLELPLLPVEPIGPGRPSFFTLDAAEGRFKVGVYLEEEGVLDGRACWRVVWLAQPAGEMQRGLEKLDLRMEVLWGKKEKLPVRVRTMFQFIQYNIGRQRSAHWRLDDRRELDEKTFAATKERFDRARALDRVVRMRGATGGIPEWVAALRKLDREGEFATLCERALNYHHSVGRAHTVTPGRSKQGLVPEDTYYHLYVPEDYKPAVKHRLLVVLHGHGNEPGGYFRHWAAAVKGRPYIVLAPKSRGLSWDLERDMGALRSMLVPLAATYSVDPDRFFLLGHSAGAKFAYLVAYASDLPNLTPRAIVAVQGSLPGIIRRMAEEAKRDASKDPELLPRMKRVAVYILAGRKDPQVLWSVLMRDGEWLRTFEVDATTKTLDGQGHAYPAGATPGILEWLESLDPAPGR